MILFYDLQTFACDESKFILFKFTHPVIIGIFLEVFSRSEICILQTYPKPETLDNEILELFLEMYCRRDLPFFLWNLNANKA